MFERLQWQRDDQPRAFVSYPAGGVARLWWRTDTTQGPPSWMICISCGETVHLFHSGQDRQSAADQAYKFWPNVMAALMATEAAEHA